MLARLTCVLLALLTMPACKSSSSSLATSPSSAASSTAPNTSAFPYCSNGSSTGNGYGWDPSVTAANGTHSCVVPKPGSVGAGDYPYCTNGSNTGNGYGWDPSVTDPKGTHSCLVPPVNGFGPNGYPYCTNGSNTGNGYGWDPSVTDPKGSHSCLVYSGGNSSGTSANAGGSSAVSSSAPSPLQGSPTTPLPALSVSAPGNAYFQITNYGSALQGNKQTLAAAADTAGASPEEKAVVIAMGMQETQLMIIGQRDASKDGTSSANCSILNLNYDMLTKVGYTLGDDGASLNNPANLAQAVGYLLTAFRTWGVQSTLNYQRGGYSAFQNGVSYDAYDYRNAILTIYNQIAADLTLESDGRRVEISIQHM